MANAQDTTNATAKSKCSVDGCANARWARGWCGTHYSRWRKTGSIVTTRKSETEALLEATVNTKITECILWPFSRDDDGYGYSSVSGARRRRTVHAHRQMCIMAHGDPPFSGAEAAHSCNTRCCINPNHLRWATRKENSKDCELHGTLRRGERHHSSKLTEAQILSLINDPRPAPALARDFSCNAETIRRIRRGEGWAWLTKGVLKPKKSRT